MKTFLPGNRLKWAFMILILGLTLGPQAGCSKKPPKYPEDHARYQRVTLAIKTLEAAYVNKDHSAIHELLLPLENLEMFEADIHQDFQVFSTIDLNLTIDRIVIEGDRVSSFVSWQGDWQRNSQESSIQSRGHGVLLWSGKQVILLRGTEGDLPFGITHRPNFPS